MRITLCGSTRFEPLFHEWNLKLALAGHTVYSLSAFGREAHEYHKNNELVLTDDEKITLDLVHLDKILNSDAIAVLNPNNYVGFSTSREIQWAKLQNKRIFWLYIALEFDRESLHMLLPAPMPVPEAPPAQMPLPFESNSSLDDDIPF